MNFDQFFIAVIRRAPHEFKIACLEVVFSSLKTNYEFELPSTVVFCLTFSLLPSKFMFRTLKNFSLLITTLSTPVLEIETLMSSATEKSGFQRGKYSLSTLRYCLPNNVCLAAQQTCLQPCLMLVFASNLQGEVAISHRIDVKSYTSLHTLVNDMFPPTSLVEQVNSLQSGDRKGYCSMK